MLLWKGVNLAPWTAEQHCFVHPVVAYTLYVVLVQARRVRLDTYGFPVPHIKQPCTLGSSAEKNLSETGWLKSRLGERFKGSLAAGDDVWDGPQTTCQKL